MDNRRRDYRHSIAAGPRLTAELTRPGGTASFAGEVLNLSVGGVAIRVGEAGADWRPGRLCQVTLSLRTPAEPVTLQAAVVHAAPAGEGTLCGLRFLPLASGAANDEREQTLWLFLLDEQRRQRREAGVQGRRAG